MCWSSSEQVNTIKAKTERLDSPDNKHCQGLLGKRPAVHKVLYESMLMLR